MDGAGAGAAVDGVRGERGRIRVPDLARGCGFRLEKRRQFIVVDL